MRVRPVRERPVPARLCHSESLEESQTSHHAPRYSPINPAHPKPVGAVRERPATSIARIRPSTAPHQHRHSGIPAPAGTGGRPESRGGGVPRSPINPYSHFPPDASYCSVTPIWSRPPRPSLTSRSMLMYPSDGSRSFGIVRDTRTTPSFPTVVTVKYVSAIASKPRMW